MTAGPEWLTTSVRTVPDFPRDGINFYDLAPVWESSSAMSRCVLGLVEPFEAVDRVVGIEARGFIFGVAVAQRLGVGFVAARKPGKVPPPFRNVAYELEYGAESLQVGAESFDPNDRVLIVDDVVATGGTACAGIQLVQDSGAEVIGVAAVIEITGLNGRKKIEDRETSLHSLWKPAS